MWHAKSFCRWHFIIFCDVLLWIVQHCYLSVVFCDLWCQMCKCWWCAVLSDELLSGCGRHWFDDAATWEVPEISIGDCSSADCCQSCSTLLYWGLPALHLINCVQKFSRYCSICSVPRKTRVRFTQIPNLVTFQGRLWPRQSRADHQTEQQHNYVGISLYC